MENNNSKNSKKINTGAMCAALSIMLGITPLIGCAKSNSDVNANRYTSSIEELENIYSYGNTYLAEEHRNKYEFSREKIRVVSYYKGQYKIIILLDNYYSHNGIGDSAYIVSPNIDESHYCTLTSDSIGLCVADDMFTCFRNAKCQYFPFEDFLNEDEKGRNSFYIEELVSIQERMNEKEKTLSLKPNNN